MYSNTLFEVYIYIYSNYVNFFRLLFLVIYYFGNSFFRKDIFQINWSIMEYNGSALVATQIYDLLNKSVETTSTGTTKANAISRIIDEFSKTDNAFEMCKQGLYVYRPFQSPNGDLGIPQTPTIADDDRQFASEYLKDCCTLFNVDENICWGMYEKYMETLPTKPNLVYDHLEMYKLKDACKKMKNLASNNELDYKTIETFLKSFQQIYGNSNTDEFLNSTNNRSTGIMN